MVEAVAGMATLIRLARNPMGTFEEFGRQAAGAVMPLRIGPFRPLLVTRPEHVQHVLRDRADNYLRDGMLWRPLRRLLGEGLAGEGDAWASHRRLVQPMFAAKHVNSILDAMSEAVGTAVVELDATVRAGRPFEVYAAMTAIVHRVVRRVFFADRVPADDVARLGAVTTRILGALGPRMLVPFVPAAVPLPGDGAFRRARRRVDEILLPVVRRSGGDGPDVVSMLCGAGELDERQVRDDVIALFAAGTESTAVALTWLWLVLDGYPEVLAGLRDEACRVVGTGPVGRAHLPGLGYTRMVLQELLRLYPPGWVIPRTAAGPDVIGGVPVRAGDTVIVSPYVTHRMAQWWDRPDTFDPERFTADRAAGRHRFAYLPFGGGPHMCLGSHFFTVEAQLVVAALLSRYRPRLCSRPSLTPRLGASLRPRGRINMMFIPGSHR